MNSKKYIVYLNELKIAEFEVMSYALMMVKGILSEYYNEPNLSVRIESKFDDAEEVKE